MGDTSPNHDSSANSGYLILGFVIISILLFRVLYQDPLFSETPISVLRTFWGMCMKTMSGRNKGRQPGPRTRMSSGSYSSMSVGGSEARGT